MGDRFFGSLTRGLESLRSVAARLAGRSLAHAASGAIAPEDRTLDRWVRVHIPAGRETNPPQRLSSLRERPFLVLLGEPGIGKSTCLRVAAAAETGTFLTVSALMNGAAVSRSASLFLDALDEYRMDGSAIDKVNGLAAALAGLAPRRLRIACRAEDWRPGADLRALEAIAGEAGIVIAHILPLDEDQIGLLLERFGEVQPTAFVAEARRRGADALLENPLSLKLLAASVKDRGEWASSRFDVFESATHVLAFEHNDVRKERRDRTSAERILSAADKAALVLLCTSARAVWRSSGPPPTGLSAHDLLMADTLDMTPDEVSDMLDTPLFTGQTDWFEPIHRSVAEYMGGRALARAVLGEYGAALPLARALALIIAPDGKAPGELRGLFAWFAAHLARRGSPDKARILVERDAVSVLVYGDAAAFDRDTRELLIANLDRDDPYFLAFEEGSSAIGALAQDDMADTLIGILAEGTDLRRLSLAFQILLSGSPPERVRPVLRAIALDAARDEWQRIRAMLAWLNTDGDIDGLRRELFDALAPEPSSVAKETLRGRLVADMGPKAVTDGDVRDVLGAYARTAADGTILRLYLLGRRLREYPRPGILDDPWGSWLPTGALAGHAREVRGILDEMLAAIIDGAADLGARQIWIWCCNAREDRLDDLEDMTAQALGRWLAVAPAHRTDLFWAILNDPVTWADAPGSAANFYWTITGMWPDLEVVNALIAFASGSSAPAHIMRIAAEVAEIARGKQANGETFEAAWRWLSKIGDERLKERLTRSFVGELETRRSTRMQAMRARQERHRIDITDSYRPLLEPMRAGQAVEALWEFSSKVYFFPESNEALDPRERIAARSDRDIADAVMAGFVEIARQNPPFTFEELGAAEARGETYHWEIAAMAGIDLLLRDSPAELENAPLELALVALRQSGLVGDGERRGEIEAWAWTRLDEDPAAGAAAILAQWEGTLSARPRFDEMLMPPPAQREGGMSLTLATHGLLDARPGLRYNTLHALLIGAAQRLAAEPLKALAQKALAARPLPASARAHWSLVLFGLEGDARRDLLKGHRGDRLGELLEGRYGDGLLAILPSPGKANLAARNAAVVRILGAKTQPRDSQPSDRLLKPYRKSDAVHESLNLLAGNFDPAAGRLLLECLGQANLAPWHDAIRHARARHLTILRDTSYEAPTPRAVLDAMAGKGPANGADLRAIVVGELQELGRSLRNGAEAAWRFYWNTDRDGGPTDAKIENLARDITLKLISERLKHYGVPVKYPEVTRGMSTRADILLANGAGHTLPVEAKRHYHADLWSAAAVQLQGYAAAEDADGNGVLLVFWYGTDWNPLPARPDKRKPATASELEDMLLEDLSPGLRERTDVVVLDVSRPKGGKSQAALSRSRPTVTVSSAPAPSSSTSRRGQSKKAPGKKP